MKKFAEFFSLLSDETRLRCLVLLNVEGELCVCELSQTLESIQPKISRHLSLLRNSGIVSDERRGQWVYYKLNKDFDKDKIDLLSNIINHIKDSEPFIEDRKNFASFKNSNCC